MTTNDTSNTLLQALRSSVARLRSVAGGFDDSQLVARAYPAKWTIADVLSHLGSGAVIFRRLLDGGILEQPTPDDFAPAVWDSWNAKSPRSKADDALVADQDLLERIESVTSAERSRFQVALGPMTLDFDGLVGMRLNEHAFHTWDVEVVGDPAAVIPALQAAHIIDRVDLVARYTAKPSGRSRIIAVRTVDPRRDLTVTFELDKVALATGDGGSTPDLELPAEAFARLVYGRLDAAHTPPSVRGEAAALDELRLAFPGP